MKLSRPRGVVCPCDGLLHPDPGDPGVVELIVSHGLDGGFAARLHKVVRKTYRRLVKNARGEA